MSTGEKLIQEGLVRGIELGRIEGRELGKAEGKVEGKAEGKAEGLLAGKRDLLVQQLEGRFGALPGECVVRIAQATSERLDCWALRLLRAATLADVFA
jgi:flagellar biosynthesis/type III secretory pathway protein FliH